MYTLTLTTLRKFIEDLWFATHYNWELGHIRNIDSVFWTILLVWFFEWLILIEYLLGEFWRSYIVFPIRIPFLLLVCWFYWLYLWAMACWRRTQFGRFTRGDRKLWAKGYTAFWVAEFVTILSFILIYFWLSWGPLPFIDRIIMLPRRSIIFEFIIYSYLIFLAYLAKLSIKWNLWRYHFGLTLIIVVIFSLLLWRDLCGMITRDPMLDNVGTRWRSIRLSILVYSIANEWWVDHMFYHCHPTSRLASLIGICDTDKKPFVHTVKTYRHLLNSRLVRYSYNLENNFDWNLRAGLVKVDPLLNMMYKYERIYPTRIGFIPKRLAMWQLLMILKMWHHLFILLWWVLYLYKLSARRKTSYPIVAVCYFNIYCCYILGLLVYSVYYAVTWETYLKIRLTNFSIHRAHILFENAYMYIWRGFWLGRRTTTSTDLLKFFVVT
jgi:hypothetical protein